MILAFGDIHLSSTPPRCRTENYFDSVLRKLAWLAELAKTRGCLYAVCTGDLFHRKVARAEEISALIQAFRRFPGGRVGTVLGNHDTTSPGRMTGTGWECLYHAHVVDHLVDVVTIDGLCITGRDWQAEENELQYRDQRLGSSFIHVTHGMLRPDPAETPFASTWIGSVASRTFLVNGHNHKPFTHGRALNLGSITATAANETEPRVCAIISRKGAEIIQIPLADEFVAVDEAALLGVEDRALRKNETEEFVRNAEGSLQALRIEPQELIRQTAMSDAARELALEYLREADDRS